MSKIQTNEVNKALKNLGFSKTESLIYIKLLEVGRATISELSRFTGVPRSSIHRYTERLVNKGFIAQSFRGKHRDLVAEPPERLNNILTEERYKLEGKLKEVESLAKELPALKNSLNV